MTVRDAAELQREVDQQARFLQGLQMSIYSQVDPAGDTDLLAQLAQAEAKLEESRRTLAAALAEADEPQKSETRGSASRGRFLG
jgi:hypothetical protein